MNTHVRDNLDALKAPPTDYVNTNEGSNYTTASTSFADVDSAGDPDLSLTITTTGGDILVTFSGTIEHDSTGPTYFDVTLDGTRQGGDDGIVGFRTTTAAAMMPIAFSFWIIAPSAASHTIKLQWKVLNGNATMHAGAGTANKDTHPQFAIREVS